VTTPVRYTPHSPDFIETLAYVQRVADSILRNNPLVNAVVSTGLMRWIGNHTDGSGNKINLLWIGSFLPADPSLPGSPAQRGFSLVRDDSTGGTSAIALYDDSPSGGVLHQTLHIGGLDGRRLFQENRQGGRQWPEDLIPMGPVGSNLLDWIGVTDNSPAWGSIYFGVYNGVGNLITYMFGAACTNGCAANFRIRVSTQVGDVFSATHSLPVNGNNVFTGTITLPPDQRGFSNQINLEGQRTNGVGEARASPYSLRCYTP